MKAKKLGLEPMHLSTRSTFADLAVIGALSQEDQSLIIQDFIIICNYDTSSGGVVVRARNALETTIPMHQGLSGHFV